MEKKKSEDAFKVYPKRFNLSKRKIAAITAGIILIVTAILITYPILNFRPIGTPIIHDVVNDTIIVDLETYRDYAFSMPTRASALTVEVTFAVTSSNKSQMIVHIMDDENFEKFQNGQGFSTHYSCEKQTSASISVYLYQAGIYHLVFDNTLAAASITIQAYAGYFYLDD